MQTDRAKKAAFTVLYEAQYLLVLRYARREVPEHVASDVVAETFTVAWRRFAEVPEAPLPWLLGVARRIIANQRRGDRRYERLLQVQQEQSATPSRDPADALAEQDIVRTAMRQMSAADREILALIGWDNLGVREAAQVLGIRASTAAVRLYRARHRLKTHLAKGLSPQPNTPDRSMPVAREIP
ncbi:RNA polymerase sigma factor [Protofrankia symbiont of Coriaria ruscifolia]|uniref:RNA polymerase sigma factor n=1 Tax=Protofrankia symbiont of Coriaria ruscifolia TaxID=1306542 RepID=UPI0013EF9469|nr:sigma-70 family RNA polymerase sigma factor [Protofrankia symbiont of Coriaria ruscifolia]